MERYGLTSQVRRSCASVAANIAEGYGRGGCKGFAKFLRMAAGSASELEYHLLLAYDWDMIQAEKYQQTPTVWPRSDVCWPDSSEN